MGILKKLSELGVFVLIIITVSIMVTGCLNKSENTETIQPNDDKEFERVMPEVLIMLQTHFQGIREAGPANADSESTQLELDTTKYLTILDKLHVSSKLKTKYDEYYSALEDSKKGGEYVTISAKSIKKYTDEPSNISLLLDGENYLKFGVDYITQANAHLNSVTPESMPIQTITPMPTPTSKVIVEYSAENIDKITLYASSDNPKHYYPSPSMTFLKFTLNITNKGYQEINVNEFSWNIKVSTKDNPNAYIEAKKMFISNMDINECKDTELENGGWTTCKITFEVPTNYKEYKIYYIPSTVNIEWKDAQSYP